MPIDKTLPDKKFPMELRFNEKPATTYLNHLSSIKVKVTDCPTMQQLMSYIPEFALATWEKDPRSDYTPQERFEAVIKMFKGEVLPTALETVGITFLISNIDLVDVTHLIRHRAMSFSAHCTGDRDQRFDDCLIKSSMLAEVNKEFLMRFIKIVEDAKQLYADMVDSRNVSILDARTILPRAMTNHYYARVSLKDFIGFLHQRLDRQIQPESDNIVAMKMLVEAARILPPLKYVYDFKKPDTWYVKTAPTDHSSNLYMPEKPRNDVFSYKDQWFVYKKQRSQMPGGITFVSMFSDLIEELENIEDFKHD